MSKEKYQSFKFSHNYFHSVFAPIKFEIQAREQSTRISMTT